MRLNLLQKIALEVIVGSLAVATYFSLHEIDVPTFEKASDIRQPLQYVIPDTVSHSDRLPLLTTAVGKLLRKQHLSAGAQVAVSAGGRVIYAQSFGYADLQDSTPMSNQNIMRVASVSKLLTAVGIMKLVDDGQLVLSQKVFGPTGILNDEIYANVRDKRMLNITIENLLNHSGGGTARYGDPMFMHTKIAQITGWQLPISVENIIRFMQTRHMHFAPGSASVYCNFGYAILGEVIAKTTRLPYEDYMRSQVFAPLGIADARIGQSHKTDALPNEVCYYEPDTSYRVPDYLFPDSLSRRSYGGTDIHTLGSAGGWVLSATDLLKLLLTIDNFESIPDQLTRNSIEQMTIPDSHYDPLGWRKVLQDTWFRTGTLAATSAIACRRPDGICFCMLLNCANDLGPQLSVICANTINDALNRTTSWPDDDLLSEDTAWQKYKTLHTDTRRR